MKAVVILGAGASADFGVPTLMDLFKDRHALRYLRQNQYLLDLLESVFWQPRGHSLSTSDQSLTVEQMLTLLRDMSEEPNVADILSEHNYMLFRKGLYLLIQRATFEGKSTRSGHLNNLINYARQNFTHTTWASFNWDCIFESSFYYTQDPYAYTRISRSNPSLAVELANWGSPRDSRHLFLKLHGGINWWMQEGILTYFPWSGNGSLPSQWQRYSAEANSINVPVILEPSYYKYTDETYQLLEIQWTRFLQELLQADRVIVVGYSLPEADSKARSTLATSFQANQSAKWMVIDPSDEVVYKYAQLIGGRQLTIARTTLSTFNANFDQLMDTFVQDGT